ncbi:MAG TPA: flagellar biosynthetic protein FliO [Terriglobales bacterium]
MNTPSQSQSPAFRITAIKVKSPDPRSVLALLPPEIKKPKITFKAAPKVAVVVEQKIAPVEQAIAAVEEKALPIEQTVTAVEQKIALLETPKYLPDPNSMLAILPAEEGEIAVGDRETKVQATFTKESVAAENEFEVIPVQEASFAEIQTAEIETALAGTIEVEATAVEAPSLPAAGKPNVFDVATKISKWIKGHVKIQSNKKRLRVCESVSLGEKRFIAVVQLDGKEFLVGGAPNSLSLLANVGKNANTTFAEVLNESYEQGRNQG